mmetsp:Transcript_38370/g.108457  ORF Transcript_38370/g.108457 Transcript_38370/m.108457 type:complete len:433 (+) Transcript_38370:985-2283(+)
MPLEGLQAEVGCSEDGALPTARAPVDCHYRSRPHLNVDALEHNEIALVGVVAVAVHEAQAASELADALLTRETGPIITVFTCHGGHVCGGREVAIKKLPGVVELHQPLHRAQGGRQPCKAVACRLDSVLHELNVSEDAVDGADAKDGACEVGLPKGEQEEEREGDAHRRAEATLKDEPEVELEATAPVVLHKLAVVHDLPGSEAERLDGGDLRESVEEEAVHAAKAAPGLVVERVGDEGAEEYTVGYLDAQCRRSCEGEQRVELEHLHRRGRQHDQRHECLDGARDDGEAGEGDDALEGEGVAAAAGADLPDSEPSEELNVLVDEVREKLGEEVLHGAPGEHLHGNLSGNFRTKAADPDQHHNLEGRHELWQPALLHRVERVSLVLGGQQAEAESSQEQRIGRKEVPLEGPHDADNKLEELHTRDLGGAAVA